MGIYFIFGTKSSWNEGIGTCFNVECVLLGRNFDFLAGYLVVTARYVVVTACYCSLPGGYCLLLVVTAPYCSFPLLVWAKQYNQEDSFTLSIKKWEKKRVNCKYMTTWVYIQISRSSWLLAGIWKIIQCTGDTTET